MTTPSPHPLGRPPHWTQLGHVQMLSKHLFYQARVHTHSEPGKLHSDFWLKKNHPVCNITCLPVLTTPEKTSFWGWKMLSNQNKTEIWCLAALVSLRNPPQCAIFKHLQLHQHRNDETPKMNFEDLGPDEVMHDVRFRSPPLLFGKDACGMVLETCGVFLFFLRES